MTAWRALALCGAMLVPDTALAIDLWPFQSEDETALAELREARASGELNLATALLERLEELRGENDPDLLLERGRLQVAKGELDEAAAILAEAANAAPQSPARGELAAVYVRLGRWPDAVNALRIAFDERGSSLPADRVASDPAFAELVGFAPFDDLLEKTREAQAGPMGRMMIRMERLENTARETMTALERITELITLVARVATSFFLPLTCFVLLGLLCTAGAAQLSPLGRPWTLFAGYGAAGAVWVSGTRSLTAGASNGLETVALGSGIVLGAWVVLALLTVVVGAGRRHFRPDPWAEPHAKATVALLAELEALGHAHLRGEVDEGELRAATERAVRRLRGRHRQSRGSGPRSERTQRDDDDGAKEPGSAAASADSERQSAALR